MTKKSVVWTGRVISGLATLPFWPSVAFKFFNGPQMAEGMAHLGLPMTMVVPLGILELTCVVIYLVPRTAFLGAILMTGYLGGAICTHWRSGDYFILHIALGIMIWLGLWLRDERLKALLPLRRL